MTNCKSISSPLAANTKLSKHGSDYFYNPTLYRSIVGALQYVTVTRPELGYAVNKVCQFMSQPFCSHWSAVKHILRYLRGTIDYGLTLQPASTTQPLYIRTFCDADWAKSNAEYRSLSLAAAEVLWVQSLLHELHIVTPTPVIYCDNQCTVSLSHNPVLHSRTKHKELNIFFVHERVLNKISHGGLHSFSSSGGRCSH